ncbi:MAG: hypothetical protein QOF89_1768 [Acidobacteriota bacterium]|jgi:predicted small metal-binding protein|nr:hypothetical protein [Acidobacteriota bacterium]
MLSVTLDIFSARRNPSWILSAKEEQELIDRVMAHPSLIGPISAPTRGLGYRGYIVNTLKGGTSRLQIPSRFRIGHLKDKDQSASWLLDTSEKPDTEVDDYLREFAERSILAPTTIPTQPTGAAPKSVNLRGLEKDSSCLDNYLTSDTDFSFWNDAYSMDHNNCYNFAANYRSDTFAQPGNYSGHPFGSFTCSSVGTACNWDGWVSSCQTNNLSIALVIWPGNDFHFYRLCTNGHWCHKPGHTAARNYDDSGNYITDPRTANRGPYTSFCSFLNANNDTMFVS